MDIVGRIQSQHDRYKEKYVDLLLICMTFYVSWLFFFVNHLSYASNCGRYARKKVAEDEYYANKYGDKQKEDSAAPAGDDT